MKNIKYLIPLLKAAMIVAAAVAAISTVLFLVAKPTKDTSEYQSNPQKQIYRIAPTLPVPKVAGENASNNSTTSADETDAEIVFVPRIIDGDTIEVESVNPATGAPGKRETIRYIGMDTPETVDPRKPVACYGHEASARNKALVEGKYVEIKKGANDKDKYGRLLRFVYLLDGSTTFINLELVKEGYARVLTVPPNIEYKTQFQAAASSAQAADLGFWGACPTYPFSS